MEKTGNGIASVEMNWWALAALGLLPVFAPAASAGVVANHYAPAENLEHVDISLLRSAHTKVDMAANSLTDWPVIAALIGQKVPSARCPYRKFQTHFI
ncbi:hypothetical protein [Methylocystis iwaonis]|uniref:Uncharacterized protein n=1 Tax=Methylocystis iwaonis TaxID=2885079 RepID=A0ABM8EEV1_9HYPH|nr:hypothetical protein [Methylocystis iwaonis]BDV36585.1 hypothetical protein SS37A_41150 [Methylocystis iwaonis]